MTEARRAVRDVGHLLWFRRAAVKRRSTVRYGMATVGALTLAAATVPAFLGDGVRTEDRVTNVTLVLPSALAVFLILSVVAGVTSGGGRELLSREQGVVFPVSPTSDHLGALLLTPLNVAWLVQVWALLGATALSIGSAGLAGAQMVVVAWILVSTAFAQLVAWLAEAVRRRPSGIAWIRTAWLVVAGATGWLYFTGRLGSFLDSLPSVRLLMAAQGPRDGAWSVWAITLAVLLLAVPVLVGLGAYAAHLAARRHPRDELRIESETHSPRGTARSDLAMMLRLDRASVWRVVPMRRGIVVLALGPGLVGVAGGLDWAQMTILPGLVASGGALLFGVNMWCLEARGILWRESLPVAPGAVFDARVVVLMEFLLVSSGFTIVLASLRAGVPTSIELAAILATWLVVIMQVVSASVRWSDRRPFAVDMRSARATPAPPAVMVGYSARLALSTTLTSLVFSGLARLPAWELPVLVALPFLAVSVARIMRARARWVDPVARVRVVSTVVG